MSDFELVAESLLGETLAQLNQAKKSATVLEQKLDSAVSEFTKHADLAAMKIINQSEKSRESFNERENELNRLVKELRASRDIMLGEIAIRQHDEADKRQTKIMHEILTKHFSRLPVQPTNSNRLEWANQVILIAASSVCTAVMCCLIFTYLR